MWAAGHTTLCAPLQNIEFFIWARPVPLNQAHHCHLSPLHSSRHFPKFLLQIDMPNFAASLGAIVGLAYLLGLLGNDLIFDTQKDMQAVEKYYCTLLPTLTRFPHLLRLAPIAVVGCAVVFRLHSCKLEAADVATVLLLGVGAGAFYTTVNLVDKMCGMTSRQQLTQMESVALRLTVWHCVIMFVLVTALCLQFMALLDDMNRSRGHYKYL